MTESLATKRCARWFLGNVARSLVGLSAAVVLAAQTTPGAPASPASVQRPSGTPAMVKGHVVADDNGRPLARVRVSLAPTTPRTGEIPIAVSTNARGEYQIKDVPPGLYRMSASRAGYLTVQWGQHRVRETGQTIEVKSGDTLERIDVRLPKGAVLAGRITDEVGQPYPGVRVEAMDLRYTIGSRQRVAFPTGFAMTDDRGEFRMSGLQPGSYYVRASSVERWMDSDRQSYGYQFTYFPAGLIEQAQPISLALAQQRTDLTLSLLIGRPTRVSGLVQSAAGTPLAGETVQMPSAQFLGAETVMFTAGVSSIRTNAQGRFEIRDIMPGDYRVSISRRSSDGQTESAALRVRVGEAGVDGLLLVPGVGSTMNGVVVADESEPLPFPLSRLRIVVYPGDEDREISSRRSFDVAADGTLQMTPVRGPTLIRLSGLPDTWMIKSIHLNDDDITDVPYDFPVGGKILDGLKIVISRKTGKISGSVTDDKGNATSDATVVLFADDSALWRPYSRFVRAIRPDGSGRFTIGQLPAGKYRVAARGFVEDGQENDPTFLEALRRDSSAMEIPEGGSGTLTLKLPRP